MLTYILIGITCLVSIISFENKNLYRLLMFNPYLVDSNRQWHRFLTHVLVHANWPHLIFNMISLYSLGTFVEAYFKITFGETKGNILFVTLYVLSAIMSSVYSFEKHKHNPSYNAVGASGAVCAVIFSGILLSPTLPMSMMFLPQMPGFIFGTLFLVVSWYLAKKGEGNIGHDAHFWGAVFGFIFPICVQRELFTDFIQQIQQYFY